MAGLDTNYTEEWGRDDVDEGCADAVDLVADTVDIVAVDHGDVNTPVQVGDEVIGGVDTH
jgi:hypothetical protein